MALQDLAYSRHGLEQTYPASMRPDPFPYARFHLTNVPLHIIQKFPFMHRSHTGFRRRIADGQRKAEGDFFAKQDRWAARPLKVPYWRSAA